MYWESALSSSIEVAIAIAGFSGIIAVFGRRDGESWNVSDKLTLQILLTASASSGLFSYLPFILLEAELEPALVWRLGSAMQIVWFIAKISPCRLFEQIFHSKKLGVQVSSNECPLAHVGLKPFENVLAHRRTQFVPIRVWRVHIKDIDRLKSTAFNSNAQALAHPVAMAMIR